MNTMIRVLPKEAASHERDEHGWWVVRVHGYNTKIYVPSKAEAEIVEAAVKEVLR